MHTRASCRSRARQRRVRRTASRTPSESATRFRRPTTTSTSIVAEAGRCHATRAKGTATASHGVGSSRASASPSCWRASGSSMPMRCSIRGRPSRPAGSSTSGFAALVPQGSLDLWALTLLRFAAFAFYYSSSAGRVWRVLIVGYDRMDRCGPRVRALSPAPPTSNPVLKWPVNGWARRSGWMRGRDRAGVKRPDKSGP